MPQAMQAAYVLHTRRYGDSSLIAELLTREEGRTACMAKGVLRSRTSGLCVESFRPLLVTLRGRGEVLTLSRAEPAGAPLSLKGRRLYCGLYLNELLVKRPAATYFVRAQGDSMIEAGIFPGDVIVVDRSLSAVHGDIVIASFNGELLLKKLETQPKTRLVPMNESYTPIDIPEGADLEIFGVATNVIHRLRKP